MVRHTREIVGCNAMARCTLMLTHHHPTSHMGCTATHVLPEQVYWVDVAGTMVVVGLVGRLFHIYDMWQMSTEQANRGP